MKTKLYEFRDFIINTVKIIINSDVFDRAASLSFATLLGLVPLFSVITLIVHEFNFFNLSFPAEMGLKKIGETFESQQIISDVAIAVKQFVDHAGQLSGISLFGLILSSILLLRDLELNLRNIFQPKTYNWLNRLELWLLVLILIPLFIGIMVSGISGNLGSILSLLKLPEDALNLINKWLGFSLLALIVSLIFYSSARKEIKFKEALFGGLIAATGIFITQFGLEWWITNMPAYSKIYGAFVFIPVFLLYVEFFWISILFGASCAKGICQNKNCQYDWFR